MKQYFWAEIVKHDKEDDCWVVIHGKVYDITKMLPNHSGYIDFNAEYLVLISVSSNLTKVVKPNTFS